MVRSRSVQTIILFIINRNINQIYSPLSYPLGLWIFSFVGWELKLLKILIIFLTVFFVLISSLSGLENLRSEHQDPAKFIFKQG